MAVTRENLFNGISTGATWDTGVVFNRTNAIPIDKFSVFESYEAASEYALNSVVAYPGQLIAVVAEDGTTNSYVVLPEGLGLGRLATEAEIEAANAEISAVKTTVNNLVPIFVGTKAQYEEKESEIAVGTIVIITDDVDVNNSDATSSILGTGVLGYLILG